MSLLDDIISGATDDSVTTSNLLRKVQIVGHYVEAEKITGWVKGELNGYLLGPLPAYRAKLGTPVMGLWTGPFGTSATQPVSSSGVPTEAADPLFTTNLHQSLAELEDLAGLPSDPGVSWDPQHVAMYNVWIEEGKVPHIEMMGLLSAQRVVTRAALRGVINTVRNTALDFALNLQTTDPAAGTLDGPTVAEPQIAQSIYLVTNHIYGDGATVAHGDNTTQTTHLNKGDIDGFIRAVRALGVGDAIITELQGAAGAEEAERPSKLKAVMDRIRSGALALGTKVSAEVATSQIDQLIQHFLGQNQ
ncbi:AbiTii domain-containing protein [Arthrobacter ramosus]|uniref:AbiTii domain-containing protein n=1 Tax=Arthrobacter ramosus TaxID=1672 RepID=A0ABV5Y4J4_ARTRM|nr:hypothetical protein [Arthrobacter ramosus]